MGRAIAIGIKMGLFKIRLWVFFCLGFLFCAGGLQAAPAIEVYFSPQGGATEAIVHELNLAKQTVTIQAYSFTSIAIGKALIAAKRRGVMVRAIVDKENELDPHTEVTYLLHAGIPVLVDYLPTIAHSKVIVIDGVTVLTGSFNFTRAAELENVENLLIVEDAPALAAKYSANFEARATVSRAFHSP